MRSPPVRRRSHSTRGESRYLRDDVKIQTSEGARLVTKLGKPVDEARPLLTVRDLSTFFFTEGGVVRAVDGASFEVAAGETLGLVGESGCGKSVTALSLIRLVPEPGRTVAGSILFNGIDILRLSEGEMLLLRGRDIGYISQDPMTSLNPTLTIGFQIAEVGRAHLGISRREAQSRTGDLLSKVGIANPLVRMREYPHQFSGGMRQRVMIAMALMCGPKLLVADEPTTALDVSVQAQILELIRVLADEFQVAVILITHDLGVVASVCDRVQVMYAGRIVEAGSVESIFEQPRMPYTKSLIDSIPQIEQEPQTVLPAIDGVPPSLVNPVKSCTFAPRCQYARDVCRSTEPGLSTRVRSDHLARCWGTEAGGWIEW